MTQHDVDWFIVDAVCAWVCAWLGWETPSIAFLILAAAAAWFGR